MKTSPHVPVLPQALARTVCAAWSCWPSVGLAVGGVLLLGGLTLMPAPGNPHLGLLFSPWVSPEEALSRAAGLDLPIAGIRLSGRLVVLTRDPENHHPTIAEISAATGAFVVNANAAALCARPILPKASSHDA